MLGISRKVPLPVIHISGHDQNNTYCNSFSLFAEKTDYPKAANCKTCLALYNRDEGIEKIYPIGGRLRNDGTKQGTPRGPRKRVKK